MIIWAYFVATRPGHLVATELTTNSSVYQSIIELNVRPSFLPLKLGKNCILQHDNDPTTATE